MTYPSAEEINALPEPVGNYIHDLVTRCDPAGELQERAELQMQVEALSRMVEELQAELDALRARPATSSHDCDGTSLPPR